MHITGEKGGAPVKVRLGDLKLDLAEWQLTCRSESP